MNRSNNLVDLQLCLLFSALGFLGNWYRLELFYNIDFLAGSVFAMLGILLLGRGYGILIGFAASTCTYLLWNHPWAIVIFTCEAVFVTFLYERRGGILLIYDALFWLCFGFPLVFGLYHYLMDISLAGALFIVFKQAVNGVVNALAASVIFIVLRFRRKSEAGRISYSELLFVVMLMFTVIPALYLSITEIRSFRDNEIDGLGARVTTLCGAVQRSLSNWLADHHKNVQILASLVGDPDNHTQGEMDNYISSIRVASHAFKGMGVFNKNSITVAYSPPFHDGKSNIGVDFSAQPHVAVMRREKKPYTSDMMLSKLGNPSPIVLLLAPIVVSGEYRGYCSGVVELEKIFKIIDQLAEPGSNITIVDRHGKVIVSTDQSAKTMQQLDRPYRLDGTTGNDEAVLWMPEFMGQTTIMQRWREAFLFNSVLVSGEAGWRVIVDAPFKQVTDRVTGFALQRLSSLCALMLITILCSYILSKNFIRGILDLQALTRTLPQQIAESGAITWPSSAIKEINRLTRNFRRMAFALRRDIARRRRVEEELRFKSEVLEETGKIAKVGGWQIDAVSGEGYWTEEVARIHDLDPDAAISLEEGLKYYEDPARTEVAAAVRKTIEQGQSYDLELELVSAKGVHKWVRTGGRPVVENGRVILVQGFMQDISERVRAEEELRKNEIQLKFVIEAAQLGTWEYDPFSGRLRWSAMHEWLWGYEPGSFPGTIDAFFARVHGDDLPELRARLENTIHGNEPLWHEYRVVRPDGGIIWVAAHGQAINDPHYTSPRIMGIVYDVTERKRLEADRFHAEEKLRQSQKLEALGLLAGGIAHDFNNILSAVVGYTELALELAAPESEQQSDLHEVLVASNRAKSLVDQIMTFSRQTQKEPVPVEPASIVKETLKLLRATLPSFIRIKQKLAVSEYRRIMADPTELHQIVLNLCTNAAYAMREKGGILGVELSGITFRDADVLPSPDLHPGEYARLEVSDTGAGIDERNIAKIFDPFFTTKPLGEGTGLGLSVVHGIVKNLGGAITVTSRPGECTRFELYFPLLPAKELIVDEPEPADIEGGYEHILIVDDEPSILNVLQKKLERLGYVATGETDAIKAVERFKTNPKEFDLVITDYTMPQLNGLALARQIKSIKAGTPVIICSGYNEEINENNVSQFDIDGFVAKPADQRTIAKWIRNVLDKERHVSSVAG